MSECKTDGCTSSKYGKESYCTPCRHKRYKDADPERYTYQALRRNARRRNKPFTLTLEEFREFCIATNYMVGKGIYADCLHIDREKEWLGYTKENIRVEVNTENVKKYIRWKQRNEQGVNEFEVVTIIHLPEQKIFFSLK